mgnify:CR=1 FL=1
MTKVLMGTTVQKRNWLDGDDERGVWNDKDEAWT